MPVSEPLLNEETRREIAGYLLRYPTKQAAVLPALHAVNGRLGYVPPAAVVEVARLLGWLGAGAGYAEFLRVLQARQAGRTAPRLGLPFDQLRCLREGEELLAHLCEKLGIRPGETTPDGRVTLEFAECLGACEQAPAILVDDVLHGDMTKERVDALVAQWTRAT